jgi:segregation and condensation protein A
VARFLAVLDLYRDRCVSFKQDSPLGDLFITWIAPESADGDPAARTMPAHTGGADDKQR